MAGDWIKWTKGLHRKKEVLGIAARLGISPAHAAGLCEIFWEWCDDNISQAAIDENGNAHVTLGTLHHSFIDSVTGNAGMAKAMQDEGWIRLEDGVMVVPNYTRHNGQTSKDRALTAERVKKYRSKSCNGNVTVRALPEKRREEVNTPLIPLSGGEERSDRRQTRAERKAAEDAKRAAEVEELRQIAEQQR